MDKALVKELELKFKCDRAVAELACTKSNYKSLELALDYIYGLDPQSLHLHPFVPFRINEKELFVVNQNIEKANACVAQDNLVETQATPIRISDFKTAKDDALLEKKSDQAACSTAPGDKFG